MKKEEIQGWLVAKVAELAAVSPDRVDPKQPFSWYGLDSALLVPLAGEAEEWLGCPMSPTLLFEYPTILSLSEHLHKTINSLGATEAATTQARRTMPEGAEPIAIIGIGCDFPGARGPRAFWQLLCEGRDAITPVPTSRWDADSYYDPDPTANGKAISRWGGFLDKVDHFDASYFGIGAREASRMDPQQRILLEVALETMEDAGYLPEKLAGKDVGVFIGISHHEYSVYVFTDPSLIDGYAASGNALSIAANRLSYAFDFRGPSMALDTACSSSLYAIRLACQALNRGEVPVAFAGGCNMTFWPGSLIALSKAGIMARDGRCKVFDARADGYVRGEGVGIVMLKPLSQAQIDGDHIYAVILSAAVSQDGRTNGLMAPNEQAQEVVLREAYRTAGVSTRDVDYIEAHGTGTYLGDAIEARALGSILGRGRSPGKECRIGSVKTNIGHLEPAAGVAGVIKVALALEHGKLPKSLHFETPNPEIPFAELGLKVQTQLEPFPHSGRPAIAGVSSFGFGGANAHAVLQGINADSETRVADTERSHLLPLSARSQEGLIALAAQFRDMLAGDAKPSMEDMCYTASVHRMHHRHRVAMTGASAGDFIANLDAFLRHESKDGLVVGSAETHERRRVVFTFSGQGSQWSGMGRQLFAASSVFRSSVTSCCEMLASASGIDVLSIFAGSEDVTDRLELTSVAQCAIFALQVGLVAMWKSLGVEPEAVLGHSIGEVAAAYTAGILSIEDAVRIVVRRGLSMEGGRGLGQMAVVRAQLADVESVVETFGGELSIAAVNGPQSVTVAGVPEALRAFQQLFEGRGVSVVPVPVDYAFHSEQMASAAAALSRELSGLRPRAAAMTFISTVTGAALDGGSLDAAYWARNVGERVRFYDAVKDLIARRYDLFIEIGAHPVLSRDVESSFRQAGEIGTVCASLRRNRDDTSVLLDAVARLYALGGNVGFEGLFSNAERKRVSLPSFPWHHEQFWIESRDFETGAQRSTRSGVHPLLGEHIPLLHTPNAHVWQRDSGATTGVDFERNAATPLLDEASLLEMHVAAGAAIGLPLPFTVGELELLQRVVPAEGNTFVLHTHALPQWAGKWVCTVMRSCEPAEEQRWEPCATASLVAGASQDVKAIPVKDLVSALGEPVGPEEFYGLFAADTGSGSGFQTVRNVWSSKDTLYAQLRLPDVLKKHASGYFLHPALLSGCFQLFAASRLLGARSAHEVLLQPRSIERIVVHRRPESALWAELEPRDGEGISADLRLVDDTGAPVIELIGIRAQKAVPRFSSTTYENVHFYDTDWVEKPLERGSDAPGRRRWLILADRGGLGAKLAKRLEENGHLCVLVPRPGERHDDRNGDLPTHHLKSLDGGLAEMVRERFGADRQPFDELVHLWSLDAPDWQSLDEGALIESQRVGCGTVLELVQELCACGTTREPRLWLVTRGAQPVPRMHPTGPLQPAQAPLWGLGKGLEFELPEFRTTLVDLDPNGDCSSAFLEELELGQYRGVPPESLGEDFERPNQIAFRGGARYVAVTARRSRSAEGEALVLDADATYLITGGTGGIGLTLAKWLVKRGVKHLVLTSRRGAGAEAALTIQALRATANVVVEQVDVSEARATEALCDRIRSTMPPLRGVFHAAGVLDDGALLDLSLERLQKVLAPKVAGTWNVHRATLGAPLDFFVLFSSIASLVGNPGQGAYNAGNMFLDLVAHARRAAGLPALSISWGPWAEVGLVVNGVDQVRDRRPPPSLMRLLSPADCLRVLERLIVDRTDYVSVLPWSIKHLFRFWKGKADAARVHDRPNLKQEFIAPRDETEERIAGLWRRALAISRVGVRDNFFELGGDSVLAGQVVSKINRSYGVSLSLRESFSTFTVEALAAMVEAQLIAKIENMSEGEARALLIEEETSV